MNRTHLLSIVISLFILIGASGLGGTIWLTREVPLKNQEQNSRNFPFSDSTDIFESIVGVHSESQDTKEERTSLPPEKQQLAIQNIITKWEKRSGSHDVQTTLPSTNTQKTPSAQEGISSIFKTLLGKTLLDELAQQSNIPVPTTDFIWLGDYSNNKQPIIGTSELTEVQQTLHAYGNELGLTLNTFILAQGDQSKLLDTFLKNKEDTTSLKRLTDGYLELSKNIEALSVPAQLENIQSGLVSSYKSVGELLWALTLAKSDEELLTSMLTYNKSSEEVAKHHISLVTLLKAYGIVFKNHEPGAVFMFSP